MGWAGRFIDMNEYACPKSGLPCEMAEWTADHLNNQFVIPGEIRHQAVRSILSVVMNCEGYPEVCTPASPTILDQTVKKFNQALQDSDHPAFDERAVELNEKIRDPIDRSLMWTLLLPVALEESRSEDPLTKQAGLYELTRLREVFGRHYEGHLVYPVNDADINLFMNLVSISRAFMETSPDFEHMTAVAERISYDFGNKYIKEEDDPVLAKLHDDISKDRGKGS